MKLALRVSLVCGITPLVLGVAIFVLWLVTGWPGWMLAGYVVLCTGPLIVLIGLAVLGRSWWLASRTPGESHPGLGRAVAVRGGLLLANFPVALALVLAAIQIHSSYTVVVHNDSGAQLEDVRISGGGCDENLGSLAPGAEASTTFWIQRDGELEFRARGAAGDHRTTIDDYVTTSLGGEVVVTVRQDGTLSVQRSDR